MSATTKTDHTPLPWRLDGDEIHADCVPEGRIAVMEVPVESVDWEANGLFIVRAVNSHAELLGMVREFVRLYDAGIRPQVVRGMDTEEREFGDTIRAARAAIAKAEGRDA